MKWSLVLVLLIVILTPSALTAGPLPRQDSDSTSAPLKLSIHYFDGLSSNSDPEPEIRFLGYGCPLSLLLTNVSDNSILLWKPYCPPGDDAIRLEFKPSQDSPHIRVARTSHMYTGGMGIPKTMQIVAGDSLVYQIDFSSYWDLPFVLQPGQQKEMFVRAVYDSKKMDPRFPSLPRNAASVWEGRVETEWQRIVISNSTEKPVPDNTAWQAQGGIPAKTMLETLVSQINETTVIWFIVAAVLGGYLVYRFRFRRNRRTRLLNVNRAGNNDA